MKSWQENIIHTVPPVADDRGRMCPPEIATNQSLPDRTLGLISNSRLQGKRVGMVVFSQYPDDPRPRRVIDALINEGMNVDLICLGGEEKSRRQKSPNGVEITRLRLKKRRGGALSYLYQYGAFILASSAVLAHRSIRRRYDLVYVHNMPDVLVTSALIPKFLGAKVVLDMHDPMPELMTTIFKHHSSSRSVQLTKILEKWSMARADLVLTVNAACKSIFASRSCPADKIAVIMNSPDEQIFPFRRPGPITTKATSTRALVIMYHGSLLERNGLDLAIDAIAIARQSVPDVELRIYGGATPFFERVMDAARGKGIDNSIRYFGPKSLEEIVCAIEACDVGIVPNHRNAFTEINTPTRIFEYLALGKPVIAPSTPGILDYFTEDSLLLVEPGNSADIARQIEYVARNYQDAIRIAERGQQIYLQHTWKQERRALVELMSGLFSGAVA